MLVKDKGRDIAILRTMGATRGAILRIFFITGASDRHGRHARRPRRSAPSSAPTSSRSASSSPGSPAPRCSRRSSISSRTLPAEMDPARDDRDRRDGAGALLSSRRSIRPGGRRGSIRWRRCATNERGAASARREPPPSTAGALKARGARRARWRSKDIARAYRTGSGPLPVLKGANLAVAAGEMVALVAPSGAGKSTLLHIAGLLERPDAGEVFIGGEPTSTLGDDARTALRRTRRSASSTSSTICCRSSRRWRTSCCRR